jgi:SAM-dependent methyltransferase
MEKNYESEESLGIYLQFHYGNIPDPFSDRFEMGRFGQFNERVLKNFLRVPEKSDSTALDLGCGVGGATFLLSKSFKKVIGIDLSKSFIHTANTIRNSGEIDFHVRRLGRERVLGKVLLPEGAKAEAVEFEVGDACSLREFDAPFDCVIALNLICRTPEPDKVIHHLEELVKPGGQLILAMPLSWDEEFTPSDQWISGNPVDYLKARLNTSFYLDGCDDLAFLMRETERKHHWCVSHCSSWTRK